MHEIPGPSLMPGLKQYSGPIERYFREVHRSESSDSDCLEGRLSGSAPPKPIRSARIRFTCEGMLTKALLDANRLTNEAPSLIDVLNCDPSNMKKIEAIIKPFKLDDVREALIDIGVEGVTVSEVKMLGRHLVHTAMSGGREYYSELMPKLKFEVVVPDSRVRRTIRAIVGKARTGRINDGKVFVVSIQEAIRIRTGERGEEAV